MPAQTSPRPADATPDAGGFDTVHARTLHRFAELVTALGGDAADLLARAGLGPVRQRPTYRQAAQLFELAAQALACPDFGMRLARMQGGGLFGPLGTVMRNSASFGEALEFVRSHSYAHSLATRIQPYPSAADDSVFMSHEVLQAGLAARAQLMEQMLLVGHLTAMEMTGGMARAAEVRFRHQPVSALAVYRRHFGCPVRFGQPQDGCLFSQASLRARIVDPDAELYRQARDSIEAGFSHHTPPLSAMVRGAITRRMGVETCGQEDAARELGLHSRTLHRRLAAEGTSFQRIKDGVRRELMDYYLTRTALSLTQISERLGFAEQCVFTRSCRRWLGDSPSRIRARGRLANGG